MFGYITICRDELKIKDYEIYRSYYCGVCRSLRKNYGAAGQMTLTYDMTFLALLLSSLLEENTDAVMRRCVVHPVKKHGEVSNKYTDYAAGMNILLSYHKLKDDWNDERKLKSNAAAAVISRAYKKASGKYPLQSEAVKAYIRDQNECEKSQETDIDEASRHTGIMFGTLFGTMGDIWKEDLYHMGFFLGKFIYAMDAYDDLDKDIRKGSYNPFRHCKEQEDFEKYCENVLIAYAAESARYFERLPIIDNVDIMKNIIYGGIWSRYNFIKEKRLQDKDGER